MTEKRESFQFIVLAVGVFLFLSTLIYLYLQETNKPFHMKPSVVETFSMELPIFSDLIKTKNQDGYIIKDNHWKKIYMFYREQMSNNGWTITHQYGSTDMAGFITSWRKEGIPVEIHINGFYIEADNHTIVRFSSKNIPTTSAFGVKVMKPKPWLIE